MIYGPKKGFGLKELGYRKISRRRASARVWRGRSADLEPPEDYQLNVGGEMGSGWPDLQTQVSEKVNSGKVKFSVGRWGLSSHKVRSRENQSKSEQR